jgi:hypothetical protein
MNLAPSGRTLIVSLLHRTPTLRTGEDGKRPYHPICDLGLMSADTAAIPVPAARAEPHPGPSRGRARLGGHTVLACFPSARHRPRQNAAATPARSASPAHRGHSAADRVLAWPIPVRGRSGASRCDTSQSSAAPRPLPEAAAPHESSWPCRWQAGRHSGYDALLGGACGAPSAPERPQPASLPLGASPASGRYPNRTPAGHHSGVGAAARSGGSRRLGPERRPRLPLWRVPAPAPSRRRNLDASAARAP